MGGTHTNAMNLNSASERELTQLPRIGADKARRIVHYRAIRKGFRDWADFARTPGISEADVEAIRSRGWIGPPAENDWAVVDRRRTSRDSGSGAASSAGFWRWARGRAMVRGQKQRATRG
ncbi:MAG: helix-hairpin-helix domain-containing protein [candidate division NC10 bacterium]